MKLIQERNKSVTYKEARVYLDELSKYGSVLGLDAIRGLLRELGNPQDDLRFIHIAGTNGKGSVLAYTSTILSEATIRTLDKLDIVWMITAGKFRKGFRNLTDVRAKTCGAE